MATWSPTTQREMEQILQGELSRCTVEEPGVYELVKIPMRSVPILRMGKTKSVLAVGESEGALLVFEDIEEGFEWCQPDPVFRSRQQKLLCICL